MQSFLALVPSDLIVRRVVTEGDRIIVIAEPRCETATCPQCHRESNRVHSRYQRTLADLPWQGRAVIIAVASRRFRCSGAGCPRRVFVERLPEVAPAYARRTRRLAEVQRHVGLALGGAAGSRLAQRLGFSVSGSTLLRLVRQGVSSRIAPPLRVIGIDDWAWKRGHRYGSIVCDLERRRIVDLLPDRSSATVEDWLSAHPGIKVIARDRGGAYGPAATRAYPSAKQIADRWHLIENASAAFLDAVRRSLRRIRKAIGATTLDINLLTCAEQRQHQGFLRREAANKIIYRLAEAGTPIKEIVRRTGHNRKVVREVMRGGGTDVFRPRASSLPPGSVPVRPRSIRLKH